MFVKSDYRPKRGEIVEWLYRCLDCGVAFQKMEPSGAPRMCPSCRGNQLERRAKRVHARRDG